MKQQTFSDVEYSNRKRKTKLEEFLEIMDEIIPWDEWVNVSQPLNFVCQTIPEFDSCIKSVY